MARREGILVTSVLGFVPWFQEEPVAVYTCWISSFLFSAALTSTCLDSACFVDNLGFCSSTSQPSEFCGSCVFLCSPSSWRFRSF